MIQDQEALKYHKSKDRNVSKISKKSKHKHLYEISSDELYEKYKDKLPIFKLNDMFDHYVNLEHKEGMNL